MPKTYYVEDLKPGTRIKDIFYISGWNPMKTKAGKDYLRMKLSDRTGEVEAVLWEFSIDDFPKSMDRSYAVVSGNVSMYQEKLQITVEYMQENRDEMDPVDFMPVGPKNIAELEYEMHDLVASIGRKEIRALVESILDSEEVKDRFSLAPAGKSMHHAYVGGLLEHTISVTRNCNALCQFYPRIDRDILIAGALLHDVGKIKEMEWIGPVIEYSDEGNLVGHLFIGATMIREYASGIKSINALDVRNLEHLVLSHHGEHQYGAPILPKSMEAMLLHYADNIDAKMYQMNDAINSAEDRNEEGNFTGWIRSLERPIFKGSSSDSNIYED